MQAIHDYGRGHQPLPPPDASTAVAETEEDYRGDITLLLAKEDFAQLEKSPHRIARREVCSSAVVGKTMTSTTLRASRPLMAR